MTGFTYDRGTWEDGTPLPDWDENDDSATHLKKIGNTSRAAFFGHEDGAQIEIMESAQDQTFYASVCPAGGAVF